MKWIGQHIWDFISRFRSDVYLEDLADPGSDTDKFLVVDTNNKVGYRTGAEVLSDIGASSESTDLEFNGNTADGVLTYGGAAQIDVESTLTYNSTINTLWLQSSASGSLPFFALTNSNAGAAGPAFKFQKTDNGTDDDYLGKIFWNGDDAGGGEQTFAEISAQIGTAAAGTEAGKLNITVAAAGSGTSNSRQVLTATGHGTDDKVDINLGYGVASTVTMPGSIAVNGPTSVFSNTTACYVDIKDTANDTGAGTLRLYNTRGAGTAQNNDTIGVIDMYGDSRRFVEIMGKAVDASSGNEEGMLTLSVASHDGDLQEGLTIASGNADDEVDVTIGNGATSLTTIAGDLDIDGDNVTAAGALTITPGGAFSVAGGANEIDLTTTGTLDINANELDMDLTDSSSITLTASEDAEDFLIRQAGAHDASILLDAAGTGTDAISLNASAGGITVNAQNTYTLTSGKSKFNKIYDFNATTFENSYSNDHGAGKILRYSPGADESPNGSELFYLHTDGTWNNARATTVDLGASQLLGVGLGASARTTGVLIEGFVRIASTEILNVPGSGAVDGLPVYVSTTSGHFDFTAPSGNNQFVRVVGYAIDDDGGDVLIYFKPSSTWIEITA